MMMAEDLQEPLHMSMPVGLEDTENGPVDLEQVRHDRLLRNKIYMQSVDKSIADEVTRGQHTEQTKLSKDDQAALCIQKHYRGFLGRKLYFEAVLAKARKEELEQMRKMTEQMEEAELLIENHKLEVLIDDGRTTAKNRRRKYISHVITIQRAWRNYKRRHRSTNQKPLPAVTINNIPEMSDDYDSTKKNLYADSLYDIGNESTLLNIGDEVGSDFNEITTVRLKDNLNIDENEVLTISDTNNPEEISQELNDGKCIASSYANSVIDGTNKIDTEKLDLPRVDSLNPIRHVTDGENDSVHSDYSELAAPLRDLDVLSTQRRESLRKSPSPGDIGQETEAEYAKRMKKINILSLAQEFADLKRINADALPFGLHNTLNRVSPDTGSDNSSPVTDSDSTLNSPVKSMTNMPVSQMNDCVDVDRCLDKTVVMDNGPLDVVNTELLDSSSAKYDLENNVNLVSESLVTNLAKDEHKRNSESHVISDESINSLKHIDDGEIGTETAQHFHIDVDVAKNMTRNHNNNVDKNQLIRSRIDQENHTTEDKSVNNRNEVSLSCNGSNTHNGSSINSQYRPDDESSDTADGGWMDDQNWTGYKSAVNNIEVNNSAVNNSDRTSGGRNEFYNRHESNVKFEMGKNFADFTTKNNADYKNNTRNNSYEFTKNSDYVDFSPITTKSDKNRQEVTKNKTKLDKNRQEVNNKTITRSDMPKNFAKITKETLPPKNYDAVVSGHDFDVYNIETALPEMDWSMLENRLQQAAVEERQQNMVRRNDREEIRKKLAMGADDDTINFTPFSPRKPSLQSRLQTGPNLQICFMNDVEDVATVEPLVTLYDTPEPVKANKPQMNGKIAHPPVLTNGSKRTTSTPPINQSDDFLQQQAMLQAEAKLALAQAGTMARMQLEVEKQTTKRPPIADKVGIPLTLVEKQKLTWRVLQMMNLAQIQIAVNDLHSQIEALNDELVRMLIERDDLHMEQDSMLVDVEDLTRRAKEISEKTKVNPKQKKATRKK